MVSFTRAGEKFLLRPELATIERFHEARVRLAIRRHRLLADVVRELERPPDLDELAGELGK